MVDVIARSWKSDLIREQLHRKPSRRRVDARDEAADSPLGKRVVEETFSRRQTSTWQTWRKPSDKGLAKVGLCRLRVNRV